MAKDLEMGYLLDFYGEVLTEKQREMLRQYYNDDLSLSEIGENFGITRQGARDAIKHGEAALDELEAKLGNARRHTRMQAELDRLQEELKVLKQKKDEHDYGALLDYMKENNLSAEQVLTSIKPEERVAQS